MSLRDRVRDWLGVGREKRGTLTIFEDGSISLGLPPDSTQEQAHNAQERLKEWLDKKATALVLPFPVDVVDMRHELLRSVPPSSWVTWK